MIASPSCLPDLGALPVFKPDAEHDAFVRLRNAESLGDAGRAEAAKIRDEIGRRNLRLVIRIAQQICRDSRNLEDLVDAGSLGLTRAIAKFDHARRTRDGYLKFSTYATYWVRMEIRRWYMNEFPLVRVPAYLHRRKPFAKPSPNHAHAARVIDATRSPASLDAREPDRTSSMGVEIPCHRPTVDVEPDADRESEVRKIITADLLATLPDRHRAVISARMGIGESSGCKASFREIGGRIGVTKERVRQIEAAALAMLREAAVMVDTRGFYDAEVE